MLIKRQFEELESIKKECRHFNLDDTNEYIKSLDEEDKGSMEDYIHKFSSLEQALNDDNKKNKESEGYEYYHGYQKCFIIIKQD